MKPTLLVLAAGMGSRYGSLKQIDPVGPNGETIIDYSVFDAMKAGFGKVIFIIRKSIEKDFNDSLMKKYAGHIDVDYVFQELDIVPPCVALPPDRVKPWGTGHAVLMAKSKIAEPFAVINGDDFYGAGAFAALAPYLASLTDSKSADYAMVGYSLKNTLSDFGTVSRGVCDVTDDGFLSSIVERTKIAQNGTRIAHTDENGEIVLSADTIVSMNFWGFAPSFFDYLESGFESFIKTRSADLKSEYYITTPIDALIKTNERRVKVLTSDAKWFGITYKEDKPAVIARVKKLVESGVYPAQLWQ